MVVVVVAARCLDGDDVGDEDCGERMAVPNAEEEDHCSDDDERCYCTALLVVVVVVEPNGGALVDHH